jgi:hypothetical protein
MKAEAAANNAATPNMAQVKGLFLISKRGTLPAPAAKSNAFFVARQKCLISELSTGNFRNLDAFPGRATQGLISWPPHGMERTEQVLI